MRIINDKLAQIAGLLAVALLSGCGNQQETVSESITTEVTTEAATEAPDTTCPVIELASDGVAYYEGDKYDPMEYVISVTDDSGETIKAEYDDKDVNIASPGDYVISYSATDSAGNSSEKKLNFKVKKEYTRDEIKEIIQKLIDEKYYIFVCDDELEFEPSEIGTSSGLYIYANFDDLVTDALAPIWGTDEKIYSTVHLNIHIETDNIGIKNKNTDTLCSELIIDVREESGVTQLTNVESVEIASDNGRISVSSKYGGKSFLFNEEGYFKYSCCFFCFESEKQIEKLKEILKGKNVSIKYNRENGEYKTFTLNKTECDNFLTVINFYDDLNEYVNNIPAE